MVLTSFEYKCSISLRNKICVSDINGDKFYKEKTHGIQDTRLNGFRRTRPVVECTEFTDSEELHLFFCYRYKPMVYVNTIYIKRNQLNLTP